MTMEHLPDSDHKQLNTLPSPFKPETESSPFQWIERRPDPQAIQDNATRELYSDAINAGMGQQTGRDALLNDFKSMSKDGLLDNSLDTLKSLGLADFTIDDSGKPAQITFKNSDGKGVVDVNATNMTVDSLSAKEIENLASTESEKFIAAEMADPRFDDLFRSPYTQEGRAATQEVFNSLMDGDKDRMQAAAHRVLNDPDLLQQFEKSVHFLDPAGMGPFSIEKDAQGNPTMRIKGSILSQADLTIPQHGDMSISKPLWEQDWKQPRGGVEEVFRRAQDYQRNWAAAEMQNATNILKSQGLMKPEMYTNMDELVEKLYDSRGYGITRTRPRKTHH